MPDEYRRPFWHRWTGLWGDVRQRWRGMDDRQRFQVGLALRVLLLVILIFIAWPLMLLVAILFAVQYARPYVPSRYSWGARVAVPTIVLVVAVTYPFYNESLPEMNLFGSFPSMETAVIMGVFAILILILVFRPEGLLGERTPEGG